ncbi:ATP-dependent DNA helicase PIF1-like [Ipomoea triloba]|uniref:ATP-dependent DNA helicase PIF1-like n=1 Tax=Ipomoea triloba TaxID=35885 RepID=UPI00125E5822|nr:ATP-dependent DNA helicase PIF1-like [Ipomoea triloba]
MGLCNGTRLIITKLSDHVVEAKIVRGHSAGNVVLIPRMSMTPTDTRLPFKFQRRQFPLMLSYAMTINKSQGQTLTHVGLLLKKPVFVHGQLYVAASRISNPSGLKILIPNEGGKSSNYTTNVVYHEMLEVVTRAAANGVTLSPFGILIQEIKMLIQQLPQVSFVFVPRTGNGSAHVLARKALCNPGVERIEWSDSIPSFLSVSVCKDTGNA